VLVSGLRRTVLPPLRNSILKHLGLSAGEQNLVNFKVCPPVKRLAPHRPFGRNDEQRLEMFVVKARTIIRIVFDSRVW